MTNSSQEEVDAAGKLLQSYIREQKLLNFNAVVINFGKSSFRNWPKFASVYSGRFNPDYIAEYVGKQICGECHPVHVRLTSATSKLNITEQDQPLKRLKQRSRWRKT
ncbi:hypothetical protein COOONC_01200 [Cooperia oncophora]